MQPRDAKLPHIARAARVLAGLTQAELARRAGVHIGSLVSFENAGRDTRPELVAKIRAALESAGVLFRPDGSITTAEAVLDAFQQIKNPTAAQKAEATIAAVRLAAGGRQLEPLSPAAAAMVAADRKRRGLED